ncbi:unnamed protein product [Vitrella brassicaformis CCMP3155]|uniref:Uncharacterized protein n=1 Tax=Vitrella brassicaformis (strain CCMP3155) TaxID=1169540 RepID=A0A0G4ET98_VITBC|nr:unnamed protein product [Vitrella brassicaformis CCMP3155]|eukprot:CEM01823.1 unnamed protein product [Vitrella brassicaformis CCMP3155]
MCAGGPRLIRQRQQPTRSTATTEQSSQHIKGTIFYIPKPKEGRQQHAIIFAEDEMMIGGRDRLMRRQMKLQEKEKAARNPFNEDIAYEQRGWWKRTHGAGGFRSRDVPN